ncbi:uncharacterized protein UHOD_12245 [Ustilago sp. UG-2017b]|nr:uncharacterized protein UHOD_12245 [Ustilago sp. UG-2017b]
MSSRYGPRPQQGAAVAYEPIESDNHDDSMIMQDMRKPGTSTSDRYSIVSNQRDYADPDAGWAEKRHSGVPLASTYDVSDPVCHRRNKLWTIGGALVAIILIIGVVVGIVVARKKDSEDSASSSKSSSGSFLSGDPSKFKKNLALHNSFWGMCYTPFTSQYQYGCGVVLASVVEDVQTLSQLTTRVRLYGADCNVTAFMLDVIQRTKVDLTIYPAVYPRLIRLWRYRLDPTGRQHHLCSRQLRHGSQRRYLDRQ